MEWLESTFAPVWDACLTENSDHSPLFQTGPGGLPVPVRHADNPVQRGNRGRGGRRGRAAQPRGAAPPPEGQAIYMRFELAMDEFEAKIASSVDRRVVRAFFEEHPGPIAVQPPQAQEDDEEPADPEDPDNQEDIDNDVIDLVDV